MMNRSTNPLFIVLVAIALPFYWLSYVTGFVVAVIGFGWQEGRDCADMDGDL